MKWLFQTKYDPSVYRTTIQCPGGGRETDDFNLSFSGSDEGNGSGLWAGVPANTGYYEVVERLKSFKTLEANWDGYDADKPELEAIRVAIGFAGQFLDQPAVDPPTVSPSRAGAVIFAWTRGTRRLEVQLGTQDTATFLHFDKETRETDRGKVAVNGSEPVSAFWSILHRHFAF